MFKTHEIKQEYFLKVGTMFIGANPWLPRSSHSPMLKNPNMENVSFVREETRAWKSTYSDIKELMDLLGGEIYRVTTTAEKIL